MEQVQYTDELVEEYLKYRQLRKALAAFSAERMVQSQMGKNKFPTPIQNPGEVLQRLLTSFDRGDYPRLLTLWDQYVVQRIEGAGREDKEMRAVEFYLNVHCATYVFRKEIVKDLRSPENAARIAARAMTIFKHYCESRGRKLVKLPEFAPYKSLAQVDFPPTHPAFQHVFMPEWVTMIRERVRRFLLFYFKSTETPKLLLMACDTDGMERALMTNSSITTSFEFTVSEREKRLKKAHRSRERQLHEYCTAMQTTVSDLLQALENATSLDTAKEHANNYKQQFDGIHDHFLSLEASMVGSSLDSSSRTALESREETTKRRQSLSLAALNEQQSMEDISLQQSPSVHNQLPLRVRFAVIKAELGGGISKIMENWKAVVQMVDSATDGDNFDGAEYNAMELCLLCHTVLLLMDEIANKGEGQRDLLINSIAEHDVFGVRGASNGLSSTIISCGAVIKNFNAAVYWNDVERHRHVVRWALMVVDYICRIITFVAAQTIGTTYCNHDEELVAELLDALSWELDEYASIDAQTTRVNSQRELSCLNALVRLAVQTEVQRLLVSKGIIQWALIKIRELLDMNTLDCTNVAELLEIVHSVRTGAFLDATIEMFRIICTNQNAIHGLLGSTSGRAIVADLLLVLLLLAICNQSAWSARAQLCVRHLALEEDVRQIFGERELEKQFIIPAIELSSDHERKILQSLSELFASPTEFRGTESNLIQDIFTPVSTMSYDNILTAFTQRHGLQQPESQMTRFLER